MNHCNLCGCPVANKFDVCDRHVVIKPTREATVAKTPKKSTLKPRNKTAPTLPVLDALMQPLVGPLVKDGKLTARGKAAHAAIVANATPVKTEHAPAVQEALDKHDALQPPKGLTRAQRTEFDRAKAVGRKAILATEADPNPVVLTPVAPTTVKEPPPIPKHVLQAEALCPPTNEHERTQLYKAAKDAWDYQKAFGIKPPLLDLFEAYRKTSAGQRSFRFEDPSEASEPTTTTGAKTMATKKTTNKKAAPAAKASAPRKAMEKLTGAALEAAVRKVAKDLKPIRVMATVAALRKIGVETTGEAIVKTVMAIRDERGEPAPKNSKFAAVYEKAAEKAPKASRTNGAATTPKATGKGATKPTTAAGKAGRAEGNGSLKRTTVTPIPKAKNAKAAVAAKTKGRRTTKRIR